MTVVRGVAAATIVEIAGEIDLIFPTLRTLRVLAVATDKRIASLPDIPTLDEAGVKGFESGTWQGLLANNLVILTIVPAAALAVLLVHPFVVGTPVEEGADLL